MFVQKSTARLQTSYIVSQLYIDNVYTMSARFREFADFMIAHSSGSTRQVSSFCT